MYEDDREYYRKWMNIYEKRCDKLIRMGFLNKLRFTFFGVVPKDTYYVKREDS